MKSHLYKWLLIWLKSLDFTLCISMGENFLKTDGVLHIVSGCAGSVFLL